MDAAEMPHRGQLDHGLDLALEQDRDQEHLERGDLTQPGADAQGAGGEVLHHDRTLAQGALADQPLAQPELAGQLLGRVGVGRPQPQDGPPSLGLLGGVEGRVLGIDQGDDLVQDALGRGGQVAMALQHPGVLGQVGLEPVLLPVALGGLAQAPDHLVDLVLEQRHLALGLDPDRSGQVALGHSGGHVSDRAHLDREVGGQPVDVVGEVAPGTGRARHDRLSAQLALRADLAGHGGYLLGEAGQGAGHLVDDVGERRDLALGLEHQLLVQIAMGDRGDDSGYATHLIGQVAGHQVNVVGQVFPGAAHALHLGLPAELALGAHLARHPGDLGGEGVELVDHGVDRVLQREDFALHVDRDLA